MIIKAIIYIGTFEPTFNPSFKKLALTITPTSPQSDDTDDILRTSAPTLQTAAPISVGIGIRTK